MTPERWQQIKGQIIDNLGLTLAETEELPEPQKGTREVLEFAGPNGKMRLEYYSRPVVLGKKTLGSKRIGSQAVVEYQYSDSEFSHELKAYRDNDGEWEEIKTESFFAG